MVYNTHSVGAGNTYTAFQIIWRLWKYPEDSPDSCGQPSPPAAGDPATGRTVRYYVDDVEVTVATERVQYLDADGRLIRMIEKYDNGSAQPNSSATNVKQFQVPLPPLAEQKRIVAKVDELMDLCDRLKAQLTASRAAAGNLMDAVVAELTAPE